MSVRDVVEKYLEAGESAGQSWDWQESDAIVDLATDALAVLDAIRDHRAEFCFRCDVRGGCDVLDGLLDRLEKP